LSSKIRKSIVTGAKIKGAFMGVVKKDPVALSMVKSNEKGDG
jgi:hypothetical protein